MTPSCPTRRSSALTQRLAGGGGGAVRGAAATDYLRLFALVSFGWMWVRMAAAVPALDEATAVEVRKTALARFFVERMLPQTLGLEAALASGASSLMALDADAFRSEEHTSELQSLMRISYAVFCLKNKK